MYLQQHDWNLEAAIAYYYEDRPSDSDEPSAKIRKSAATCENPSRLSVLSWNLDGLDNVSLFIRTKAAIETLKKEDADVVFLQEVVHQSWQILQDDLSTLYHLIPASTSDPYFTAVLLKITTVFLDSKKVQPFFTSVMMRKLQILHVNVKGIDVKLMNTHLESTAAHSVERLRQLKICFDEIASTDPKYNVIFGGDLNLNANDMRSATIPKSVVDIWEMLGSKPETRYTWDTRYNTNKQMDGPGRPRCRFDRFYFRSSCTKNIVPYGFNLTGIKKIKNCSKFASDHWGIHSHFHIATE